VISEHLAPHQAEGAAFLRNIAGEFDGNAYLADPPGYGKTRTLIAAAVDLGAKRPLILAPAAVRTHWLREIALVAPQLEPTVASYEKFVSRPDAFSNPDALILDEAHRLRHSTAKRTKLLLGRGGLARSTRVVLAASGTPMWKNPMDLWTIVSSMFPKAAREEGLQYSSDWLEQFCNYYVGEYGLKVTSARNQDQLTRILQRFMVRREDVEIDVPILWSQLPLDAGTWLNGDPVMQRVAEALATSEATGVPVDELLDAAHLGTYRRLVGEAKAHAVVATLLEELTGTNDKVVVFGFHHSVLDTLEQGLTSLGVVRVDGSTPAHRRQKSIDQFQLDPNTRVYLGQTLANQEGITLTAARRAILVEPEWSAKANLQAGKRIARIGQKATYTVVQLVSLAGTIDDAIVGQNLRETRMEQEVFGASGSHSSGVLVR
jgi:SWI/SNF-related matrix-associated actin-dependent regulator 1 of chromatin subfamily A